MQTKEIPVFLVNGVYFPWQKLRLKMSAQNQSWLEEGGCFGVVSKRRGAAGSSPGESSPASEAKGQRAEFVGHHSVGVLVRITDQPLMMRDYAEFSVEGVSRFAIKKVLTADQTSKLCEVEMLDDAAEFAKAAANATAQEREARDGKILQAKTAVLELMELYDKVDSDGKERPSGLMDRALRISKSARDEPVKLLFLIAATLRLQPNNTYTRNDMDKSKTMLQELLNIDSFDQRLEKVNELLAAELARVKEVKTRAEKLLQMNEEKRKEAI